MKLAIFDFDGTLLMTDTLPALAKEWTQQKLPRINYVVMYLSMIPLLIAHKTGFLGEKKFRYLAVVSFNRIYHKMTHKEINDFFENAYAGLSALFNPVILNELQAAISQGYRCILISGAYTDLLRVIAKHLGFDMVIGSDLAFKDGVFDHHKKLEIIEGRGKLELLKKAIVWESVDWQASRSYGNSLSDIEVMKIVGEPIAVNPEPHLLTYALQHNWRVITVPA